MNTLILDSGAEELAEGLKTFLQTYLPDAIIRINNYYNDGNDISAPEDSDYVLMDPLLAFNYILENGHFPAICIFVNNENDTEYSEDFTIDITGFICEDDWEKIEALNQRFAKAIKATLLRDITIGGICGGFSQIKIDYSPAYTKDNLTFKAFQILITFKS